MVNIINLNKKRKAKIRGEKEKCLASGMNDYASKPILKEELEKIILKWI